MIRGMVEGLAARLKENPGDIEGWLRLVLSYEVLQEHEKAAAAIEEAREIFADDEKALARIGEAEDRLGGLSPGGTGAR